MDKIVEVTTAIRYRTIRRINSITKSLSKPYFNKNLKKLLKKNLENANIIYDYIIVE
jgi:hypothetical protein